VPRKLFALCALLVGVVPFLYSIYVSFEYDSQLPGQPDAVAGRVYAVYPNHSRRFATEGEVEHLNRITTGALVGILLAMVGAATLSQAGSGPTVSLRHLPLSGADFLELPRALSPRRLGTFLRSLWDSAWSHWKQLFPFWLAPTYFVFMSNVGSRWFGHVLTVGLVVPLPIFWAFIRAGRLYARGTISFPEAMFWIILVPFLVLLALAPVLRVALGSSAGLSFVH